MIDWTNIKKIDAHIHLMPPDVIEANKEYGGNFIDFGDVEDYLKIMDKYNIESAFIMPFNDPYMLSMDFNVCTVHNNLLDMCSPTRIKNIIKKYPKLRMSIAHIGGFQYEELTDLGLFFNISAILPDLVDKYGIAGTNKILRRLDVEKLVFATDYPDNRKLEPIEIYDKYFEILSQMDFSEEEAEKICRLNALKMINK